jgi:hypothetical protein
MDTEGQNLMEEWKNNLPIEIEKLYSFAATNVKKFQTFDLLSYLSHYNQRHDSENYSDDRGNKHFFVSETIALLCLKNDFVDESTVSEEEFMKLTGELQNAILSYCGRSDMLEPMIRTMGEDVTSDAADLLSREAKQIRNPGLPDHHLLFTEKLFEPIQQEIKKLFGFSVADSVLIRKLLSSMINEKCNRSIDEALSTAKECIKEITKYKKKKVIEENSIFVKEQLDELASLPYKEIAWNMRSYFLNKLFYKFGDTFTFTAEELSDFTGVELASVESFLNTFSCGFPSLKESDKIYEPISILKSKPLLEHHGRYLIPSFPLLTWAVEDLLFDELFAGKAKLTKSISDVRHDFVLTEGFSYFRKILPTAKFFPANLNYYIDGVKWETDGLILYDKTLFVIEAKGHRITPRAKKGDKVRTQKHLKQIIEESYSQGVRVVEYIESTKKAEFKPLNSGRVEISKSNFDDVVVVCLTFEPIGNLSMLIKGTNEIGYFKSNHFPLIISIYDLVMFADIFENPIVFMHYVRRRKKFLENKHISIYEEMDLVSYFLSSGLYIDRLLQESQEQNVNWIHFSPDTDAINDYYMYKFGHKSKFTEKPKSYITKEFDEFLLQLDSSMLPHRVRMGLLVLEFNNDSIKQLMAYLKKIKKLFAKDKTVHDCSVYTSKLGGIGVTIMTGTNIQELSFKLDRYCTHKLDQQNSNAWIGLGDTSIDSKRFNFQSMYFAMGEKVE